MPLLPYIEVGIPDEVTVAATLGWSEQPASDAAAGLEEDATRRQPIWWIARADASSFLERLGRDVAAQLAPRRTTVRWTLADLFEVARSVYLDSGIQGLVDFTKLNYFAPPPADFFGGSRLRYALQPFPPQSIPTPAPFVAILERAAAEVLRIAKEAIAPAENIAVEAALGRLDAAQQELLDETARYCLVDATDDESLIFAIGDDAPLELDESSPDLPALRSAIAEIARLRGVLADRQQQVDAASQADQAAIVQMEATLPEFSGSRRPPQLRAVESAIAQARQLAARLPALEAARNDAQQELAGYLDRMAPQYPILWRLFDVENLTDPAAVAESIGTLLQESWANNLDLHSAIEGDASTVWRFRPLVETALLEAGVPRYSIAWTSAQEKLASTNADDAGAAEAIASVTGTAIMAESGLEALGVLSVEAPPLAAVMAVVIAVDKAANLVSAIERYRSYREQQRAARCCLSPELSVAAEPSLFGAALDVVGRLLSLTQHAPVVP